MFGHVPTHSAGVGSKGIELFTIEDIGYKTARLEKVVNNAIHKAIDIHQKQLRQHAESIPAWKDHANAMYIEVKDGRVNYLIRSVNGAEIDAIEYGTPDKPASPLLRTYMREDLERFGQTLNRLIKEAM